MAMLNNQRVYPQDKYGKTQTKNEPNGKMSVRIVYPLLIPLGVDLLTKKKCGREENYPQTSTIFAENLGDFLGASLENWVSRFSAGFSWQNRNVSSFEDEDDHIQVTWVDTRPGKHTKSELEAMAQSKFRGFSNEKWMVIVIFQFAIGQFTRPGIPMYSHYFPINSHLKPPFLVDMSYISMAISRGSSYHGKNMAFGISRRTSGQQLPPETFDGSQTRLILVGGIPTPLKDDGVRQLGWWNSQYIEK